MDYLSSGFSGVDRAQDPDVFVSCLQTLSSLPYFQHCKEKSIELLCSGGGSKMLEVGCGLGQDALAIAHAAGGAGGPGYVVAVDMSKKMMENACRDGAVRLCLADACRLPFGDGVFHAARADRVLQHIVHPKKAFWEMVRTVRDKGRVVVYEPDWGTFIISPGNREVCRTMTRLFADTFPCGWVGRRLPGFFREQGLENIKIEPLTFFTSDLPLAVSVFDLVNNAGRAQKMGYVSDSLVKGWLEGLKEAHRRGSFFCSYTGFLVSGEKAD